MQYVLKQKLVSLGNNFTIADLEGRDAFRVSGALATLGDKLSFADANGNELLYIEQKVFSWVGMYEVSRDGKVVAQVRRNLRSLLRRRFTVENDGCGKTRDGGRPFGVRVRGNPRRQEGRDVHEAVVTAE